MDMTAYIDLHTLRGHSDSVNCVAFSPCGKYLASGGDDNLLIVWTIDKGREQYRLFFEGPIFSLLWHPVQPETIVIGRGDGVIYQSTKLSLVSNSHFILIYIIPIKTVLQPEHAGTMIHIGIDGPVHCMRYSEETRFLAVGCGHEVHVVKEEAFTGLSIFNLQRPFLILSFAFSEYRGSIKLELPGHLIENVNEDQRVRPRGLHFRHNGNTLIVSYLNHGIV
jgi:WD domain, G-beta repeat